MRIEIHAIDRDHGDGHYVRRYSFRPPARSTVNHMHPEHHNLVLFQDTYGGLAATVEVPAGSEIGTSFGGDEFLLLPDASLMADEAYQAAQDGLYGLAIIPHRREALRP